MKTLAIIPCTNQKADVPGKARDLWIGSHFQLVLAHAEMFYDEVLIMSYKYGLISPEMWIEPYDIDIRNSSIADKFKWWVALRSQIIEMGKSDTKADLIALYTGNFERERIMREFVRNGMRQVIIPFEGQGIGNRMALVYDCVEPFDRARAERGDYMLPENYGEPGSGTGKNAPPATRIDTESIEWED